ncbi:MAG TPA: histidine phosphatase family protein, partial [Leptospiraceae bacterium]|nr:histidine phosphatase family protein [Leptospiraceae bacterium]
MKHTYAIMRHGQSQANVEGIIVSDPAIGVARYGLTEAGKKQALESARSSDFKARAIYSSDFRRARETAEIVAALQKAPVTETELLRERFFGDYNGTPDTQYQRV